jgi:hypothetical protein
MSTSYKIVFVEERQAAATDSSSKSLTLLLV